MYWHRQLVDNYYSPLKQVSIYLNKHQLLFYGGKTISIYTASTDMIFFKPIDYSPMVRKRFNLYHDPVRY